MIKIFSVNCIIFLNQNITFLGKKKINQKEQKEADKPLY